MKLGQEQLQQVATLFRALAEPTRLAIIQDLKSGERNVSEIVSCQSSSQANISKQLKQLHEAGLIERRKQSNQVYYQIADPMVLELCKLVCEKINRDPHMTQRLRF